jgi:predicted DNA-binding transcriptional regulator AlpA
MHNPIQAPATVPVEIAATYLGLSVSTLNKLRVFGGGPVYLKLGRRVAYDLADLDDWLASKRRRSTSDQGGAG